MKPLSVFQYSQHCAHYDICGPNYQNLAVAIPNLCSVAISSAEAKNLSMKNSKEVEFKTFRGSKDHVLGIRHIISAFNQNSRKRPTTNNAYYMAGSNCRAK